MAYRRACSVLLNEVNPEALRWVVSRKQRVHLARWLPAELGVAQLGEDGLGPFDGELEVGEPEHSPIPAPEDEPQSANRPGKGKIGCLVWLKMPRQPPTRGRQLQWRFSKKGAGSARMRLRSAILRTADPTLSVALIDVVQASSEGELLEALRRLEE